MYVQNYFKYRIVQNDCFKLSHILEILTIFDKNFKLDTL